MRFKLPTVFYFLNFCKSTIAASVIYSSRDECQYVAYVVDKTRLSDFSTMRRFYVWSDRVI